jgi:serine/threonine-protein kinase
MSDTEMKGGGGGRKLEELAVWRRLMEASVAYAAAWERGERPELQQFAADFSGEDRELVLEELRRLQTDLQSEVKAEVERFPIVTPLARGGMGQVSVARDHEFHRDVALKEIRGGSADDRRYRSRFLREAEITAQLEHHGVIPVYARGDRQDGRPYYVMRLIRGEQTGTLKDAIRRLHDLQQTPLPDFPAELRRLVRRLIDVCNTMSYVHSRGVIHRDLKPSNILLGAYGETLVVDWGLAHSYNSDLSEFNSSEDADLAEVLSQTNTPGTSGIGTPGYAPPEQFAHSGAAVTPTADVYSLGTILYCLLTGRPPFAPAESGNPEELMSRIVAGDFPAPRVLNPAAPPALEAVCLRAMQVEPQQRYQSAAALGAELDRWLADSPVLAWPEPSAIRFRRWLFSHRIAAAAIFAGLSVSVPVLLGWLVIQSRHSEDLRRRQASLIEANTRAEAARDKAEQERARADELLVISDAQKRRAEEEKERADAERSRAELRERLALRALERFGEVISREPLLQESGSLAELRQRLLREPLRFYSELQQQLEADKLASPQATQRFAQSAIGLASQHTSLGDAEKAASLLDQAIELLRGAIEKCEPTDDHYFFLNFSLARALRIRGVHAWELGKPAVAEPLLQEAVSIFSATRSICPKDESVIHAVGLAESYSALGVVFAVQNRGEAAATSLREAIRVLEQAGLTSGEEQEHLLHIGDLRSNLGVTLMGLKQFEDAEREYAAAAQVFGDLERRYGAIRGVQHRLAAVKFNLGKLHEDRGEVIEAIREHEAALRIRRALHVSYPSFQMYRQTDMSSREVLVELLLKSNGIDRALEITEQWVSDSRKISDLSPGFPEYRVQLLDALHSAGHLLTRLGRSSEAEPSYREALAINREIMARTPGIPLRERTQAELLEHVAKSDIERGDFAAARTVLEEAIPLQKAWLKQPSVRPLDRAFLRQMLKMLEKSCMELNDAEAARAAREEADSLQ